MQNNATPVCCSSCGQCVNDAATYERLAISKLQRKISLYCYSREPDAREASLINMVLHSDDGDTANCEALTLDAALWRRAHPELYRLSKWLRRNGNIFGATTECIGLEDDQYDLAELNNRMTQRVLVYGLGCEIIVTETELLEQLPMLRDWFDKYFVINPKYDKICCLARTLAVLCDTIDQPSGQTAIRNR